MIWQYDSTLPAPHEDDITQDVCAFCHEQMSQLMESVPISRAGGSRLRACPCCGWWTFWRQTRSLFYDQDTGRHRWSLYGAAAQLMALDLADLSQGIEEVRRFLIAKYDARFELHPRLFELTVASVFCDLGYETEATAYTADGGIDVILRQPNGSTSGVQVKRVRTSIEVEQIRALAGALLLGGHTSGIYVTTSRFRSGAVSAATRLRDLAMPVELVDSVRFLEALKITQRQPYTSFEEWEDIFGDFEEATIYEDEMEGG
jgi:restriction system protein